VKRYILAQTKLSAVINSRYIPNVVAILHVRCDYHGNDAAAAAAANKINRRADSDSDGNNVPDGDRT